MDGTHRGTTKLFAPLPSTTLVGDGTEWPVAMTMAQLVTLLITTKEYDISGFASGTTTAINLTPWSTGNAPADKLNFAYTLGGSGGVNDSVPHGGGVGADFVSLTMGLGPGPYYDPATQLFYPQLFVSYSGGIPGPSLFAANTNNPLSNAQCGTGTILGAPIKFYIQTQSPPTASVTIAQASAFP